MVVTTKFQELEQFANDHGLYITTTKEGHTICYSFFDKPNPDIDNDACIYTAYGILEAETYLRGWVAALYHIKDSND